MNAGLLSFVGEKADAVELSRLVLGGAALDVPLSLAEKRAFRGRTSLFDEVNRGKQPLYMYSVRCFGRGGKGAVTVWDSNQRRGSVLTN